MGARPGPRHDRRNRRGRGRSAWRGRLAALIKRPPNRRIRDTAHGPEKVHAALEGSRVARRALWLSLAGLLTTAALQGSVALLSGSVALLGDTLHNFANALATLPLAIAFLVNRRPPTTRYTFGYGRAEDFAALVIVTVVGGSAVLVGYAAVDRFLHPAPVQLLSAVAVAAIIGFTGNELVVQLRIWVGRRIGSTALVTDGLRARANGYTSLLVLAGTAGSEFGVPWADPVAGVLIAGSMLIIFRGTAGQVYLRLMDAVDPAVLAACQRSLQETPGVRDVTELRLRWIGHRLRAECTVAVNPRLTIVEAHRIAEDARHRLSVNVPKIRSAVVHADPEPAGGEEPHDVVGHDARD
jgi:cation diffusion facilitator family transporter